MDRAHDSRRCEPKRCSNNDAAVQCHENIETGTWHSRSTKTNEFQAPDPRGRGAVPAVDAARGHRLRRGGADQEDTDELGAERGLGGRAAVRLHGLHRLHHHLLGGVDAADGDHGPADGRPVPAPRRCRGQHRPDGGPAGVLQRVVHGAGAEDPLLRAHLGALPGGQGLAPRTGGAGGDGRGELRAGRVRGRGHRVPHDPPRHGEDADRDPAVGLRQLRPLPEHGRLLHARLPRGRPGRVLHRAAPAAGLGGAHDRHPVPALRGHEARAGAAGPARDARPKQAPDAGDPAAPAAGRAGDGDAGVDRGGLGRGALSSGGSRGAAGLALVPLLRCSSVYHSPHHNYP
mmetsp:Transcript_11136/g.17426  ORF Transcript_11136/g.17426 Transcript_11136/m.17426 type:complete len:345 (-) Transcript_11136:57-1091(-)